MGRINCNEQEGGDKKRREMKRTLFEKGRNVQDHGKIWGPSILSARSRTVCRFIFSFFFCWSVGQLRRLAWRRLPAAAGCQLWPDEHHAGAVCPRAAMLEPRLRQLRARAELVPAAIGKRKRKKKRKRKEKTSNADT
jgi:hypothetical protein